MCNDTVLVRRVMFSDLTPVYNFDKVPMKAKLLNSVDEIVEEDDRNFTQITSHMSGK